MFKVMKSVISLTLCIVVALVCAGTVLAETDPGQNVFDVPDEYKASCPQQGTTSKISVPIEEEWMSGETIDSEAYIYLPHGYNENNRYNFVLMLEESDLSPDHIQSSSRAYDWIVYSGEDPFIVLTVKVPNTAAEMQYRTFAYNVRMNLLPYIAEHYSVYANGSLENRINNRNHTAVFAKGDAVLFAWCSVMRWNPDLFGSCYLGNFNYKVSREEIVRDINKEWKYLLNSFSCGAAGSSARHDMSRNIYKYVVDSCDTIEEKVNAHFFTLSGEENADIVNVIPQLFTDNDHVVKNEHAHAYRNNKCVLCGKEPAFYEGNVPGRYYFPCPKQGTVVPFKYETHDWWTENSPAYEKEGLAYLPYGYDESQRYNVMILLHGHTLDRHAFMDKTWGFNYGAKVQYRNDYDWMFYDEICRPLIIITLDTPPEAEHNFTDMQYELRYDVLPYIAEHFATYAKDGSEQSLIFARDHFGLGGSSNGAGFTHGGGLHSNIAYFGSIAMMSGGMNFGGHALDINKVKDQYKINCLVRTCGTQDPLYDGVYAGYEHLDKAVDYLKKNKNLYMFTIDNGHNMRVGYTCLANAFQVLFPPTLDDIDIIICDTWTNCPSSCPS